MSVHENNMHTNLLPELFQNSDHDDQFLESHFSMASPENIFSILEALDQVSTSEFNSLPVPLDQEANFYPQEVDNIDQQQQQETTNSISQDLAFSFNANPLEDQSDTEVEAINAPKSKKQKVAAATGDEVAENTDGQQKISHITVERNRRKQMNENLSVLRSLMPCFYVKRGDQASIVGGVVDYITELQQVLQSLEAKKQRKVFSEVLSPRVAAAVSSPRNLPISPRKPPLSSPRLVPSLPISPRTPTSPYNKHHANLLQSVAYNLSPTSIMSPNSSPSIIGHNSVSVAATNELVANSKSEVADVEVKFSGPNVLLKTVSARIPGQALKIISALEDLSLEIINASLTTTDHETMINSFTIKIGIECQLSAEELAHLVQQTFCSA